MDEDQDPDQAALEYARAYARRQLGEAPANVQAQHLPARQPGTGQTMRTLIVVAGLVAVAWMWFRSRRQ